MVPSTQAELCGVQRGWQLVAVGSFAVATTPELMEALKQYREGLQALRAMAAQGNGSTAAADAAQVALGFVTTEATAAADACSQSTSSSWASSPATPPPPSAPAPSPPPSARSQMAPELSREDAIVQGRERLTKRLASETLKEAEMEDDGNCQVECQEISARLLTRRNSRTHLLCQFYVLFYFSILRIVLLLFSLLYVGLELLL